MSTVNSTEHCTYEQLDELVDLLVSLDVPIGVAELLARGLAAYDKLYGFRNIESVLDDMREASEEYGS
jgi:hypothetical protein